MPPSSSSQASDRFSAALRASLSMLARQIPGGWAERRGDAFGLLTRLAISNLNGVLCASPHASPTDVAALLEHVRAAAVPYSLQLRPRSTVDLVDVARTFRMSLAEELPAMALEDPARLSPALNALVSVRRLGPEETGVHLAVAAEGFESSAEVLAPLVEALVLPGVHLYVGEVGGEPVVTGARMRVGDGVGVFNVATPPRHRRRGYATALTARAVLDGFADGATWAFLQSSPMACSLYERLGFRTVERWEFWVAGQPVP